jgi:hypothetical protein
MGRSAAWKLEQVGASWSKLLLTRGGLMMAQRALGCTKALRCMQADPAEGGTTVGAAMAAVAAVGAAAAAPAPDAEGPGVPAGPAVATAAMPEAAALAEAAQGPGGRSLLPRLVSGSSSPGAGPGPSRSPATVKMSWAPPDSPIRLCSPSGWFVVSPQRLCRAGHDPR